MTERRRGRVVRGSRLEDPPSREGAQNLNMLLLEDGTPLLLEDDTGALLLEEDPPPLGGGGDPIP